MAQPVTIADLLDFALGRLSPDRSEAVAAHLTADAEARRRVDLFRDLARVVKAAPMEAAPIGAVAAAKAIMAPAATRPSLAARLGDLLRDIDAAVASLLFDSRAQPALAGVRGAGVAFQLAYRTDLADIDLHLDPEAGLNDDGAAIRWRMMGQVSSPDGAGGFSVVLTPAGEDTIVTDATADDRGRFELDVAPGCFDLYVTSDAGVIVLRAVDIP